MQNLLLSKTTFMQDHSLYIFGENKKNIFRNYILRNCHGNKPTVKGTSHKTFWTLLLKKKMSWTILSINTNNFAHFFAMCRSEDQSSYASLNKRTQREASSHLSASLPEVTPVSGQLFCINFNILKSALIYTNWWSSKGAAFVAIADRGSEKHQSWFQADTGTKTELSFSWLFARRHPTQNSRKISGIRVVKSIPDDNISRAFYFSLFINLYKQLQSALNICINMQRGKMHTVKKKGQETEAGEGKFKHIFVFFFHNVQYWNFSLLLI